eukprot:GSMAST32.ASY1.ANO1.2143.1 assembled CDS
MKWNVTIGGTAASSNASNVSSENYPIALISSYDRPIIEKLTMKNLEKSKNDLLVTGSEQVILHGKNFGPVGTKIIVYYQQDPNTLPDGTDDYASMKYDNFKCDVLSPGHVQVKCYTRAGVGANHLWHITVGGQTESSTAAVTSYMRPKMYVLFFSNFFFVRNFVPNKFFRFFFEIFFQNTLLPLAIRNVSFDVSGGEKIGIVGRTGAGKSSLMSVLFRIVNVTSGVIHIDGVDITTLGIMVLRKSIAAVPQTPLVMEGSLRCNLDPFDEFSDSELLNVIDKVGLTKLISRNCDIHNETNILNINTICNLSAGQKQQLSLARVLLSDSKIVMYVFIPMFYLHFFFHTKFHSLIQDVIRKEFKRRTVFTIAHRLSTVVDCDRIIVMGYVCLHHEFFTCIFFIGNFF